MDKKYTFFDLKNIQAPNFLMTPLELKDFIDFEVKRVYFICDPINEKQSGKHAHIALEDELFVLMSGTATVILDDGSGLEEFDLVAPKTAIRVPHMVWHGFKNFSDDAILLAITSTNYNPNRSDYCEDYEQFKQLVKNQ